MTLKKQLVSNSPLPSIMTYSVEVAPTSQGPLLSLLHASDTDGEEEGVYGDLDSLHNYSHNCRVREGQHLEDGLHQHSVPQVHPRLTHS